MIVLVAVSVFACLLGQGQNCRTFLPSFCVVGLLTNVFSFFDCAYFCQHFAPVQLSGYLTVVTCFRRLLIVSEIMVPAPGGSPRLSKFPLSKPVRVSQNIALHTSPAARTSTHLYLNFCLPGSFNFIFFHKLLWKMYLYIMCPERVNENCTCGSSNTFSLALV